MPLAPAVKAVIIISSVIAAAGIAIYEQPQIKAWLDNRAREIKQFLDDFVEALDPEQRSTRANEIIRLGERVPSNTQHDDSPSTGAASGIDRAAQVQAANRRRLYELAEPKPKNLTEEQEVKQAEDGKATSSGETPESNMEQTVRDLEGLKVGQQGAADFQTPLIQIHNNDSGIAVDAPDNTAADMDVLSVADTESLSGSVSVIHTPGTSRPMTPSGYSELQDPLDDLDGFSETGTETASHVSAQDASDFDGEGDAEDNDVISVASGVSDASGRWSLVGGHS